MTPFVEFFDVTEPGKFTKTVEIRYWSTGALLGRIRWHWPKKQYGFVAEPKVVFVHDALQQITERMDEMNREHYLARHAEREARRRESGLPCGDDEVVEIDLDLSEITIS